MTTRAPERPAIAEPQFPYMTLAAFHALARTGTATPEVTLRKSIALPIPVEVRAPGDNGSRVIRVAITSERIDREEDTIALGGWELANYERNPVVLWAHDYYSLPIGRSRGLSIAVAQMRAQDGSGDESVRLMYSDDEFPAEGVHPFADTVYALIVGGYINATSVGFRPLTWSFDEERWGVNFLTQEMLEHSWVPIPANPDALIAARSAGIALDPIKEWAELAMARIEGQSGMWLPKSTIEGALRVLNHDRTVQPGASVERTEEAPTVTQPNVTEPVAAATDPAVTDPPTDPAPAAAAPAEPVVEPASEPVAAAAAPAVTASADEDTIDLSPDELRALVRDEVPKAIDAERSRLRGRLD